MKKLVFGLIISFLGIFSSAFNIGVLGDGPAIFFCILGIIIVWTTSKNKRARTVLIGTLVIVAVFASQINKRVTTLPFIFPILDGGEVLVIREAYCYSDNSGFGSCYASEADAIDFAKNFQERFSGKIIHVREGNRFPIIGVSFRGYDLGQSVSLKVSVENWSMNIDRDDYSLLYKDMSSAGGQVFKVNKPIISRFTAISNTPITNVTPMISRLLTDNP